MTPTPVKKPLWRRLLPLAILLALVALVWLTGLHRYVSLDALKTNYAALRDFVAARPVVAPLAFVGAYALVVALSVPGAIVLTLAGGLLFGTWLGTLLVVTGATLGAIAVFLVARTSLGGPLRRRAGPRLERMAAGFQEDAWSYMFFLRLVPLVPFWLVNVVPAFLGVPLSIFAVATFFGIVPATFVYAGVGNGLAGVIEAGGDFGLGSILTPAVVLPLVGLGLLALLPIAIKRLRGRGKSSPQS